MAPALLWTAGCGTDAIAPPTTTPTAPAPVENRSTSDALAVLATLPIKGRAPKTGYERARFGEAWTDDVDVDGGHNGCDTRNDILRRDLTAVVTKDGTRGCKVQSGTHFDEYTGETTSFTSGQDTSPLVQIDHAVSAATTGNASISAAYDVDGMTLTHPVRVEE